MGQRTNILWLRGALRTSDHPALDTARDGCENLACVYIYDPDTAGEWSRGPASAWFLSSALDALDKRLRAAGNRLVCLRGKAENVLPKMADKLGAQAIFTDERCEPWACEEMERARAVCGESGLVLHTYQCAALYEPDATLKANGEPYKVFTPYHKNILSALGRPPDPPPTPRKLPPCPDNLNGNPPGDIEIKKTLPPDMKWLTERWSPNDPQGTLEFFIEEHLANYDPQRDFPAADATSRLSPHLAAGTIGPREIWNAVENAAQAKKKSRQSADAFQRQLVWRDFAMMMLRHNPDTPTEPLNASFKKMPWRDAPDDLARWKEGRTGYPIVDAAMRQLNQTGWMHNRLRMVAASFLVKDLGIHWLEGARYFWEQLADADLANNTFGWQWVAGCGADAAPYFRVFNPVTQSKRFDPDGAFIREWIAELREMDSKSIHAPWEYSIPGQYYPPIVNHKQGRIRALDAYAKTRD